MTEFGGGLKTIRNSRIPLFIEAVHRAHIIKMLFQGEKDKQELPSDSIARLDELKGGGGGCNVKSVALIFRSWVWAR